MRLSCFLVSAVLLILCAVAPLGCYKMEKQRGVFNVSYDPTRELYSEYNELFANYWKEKTGETIVAERSNGGSRAQSRAVQSGLAADVVTLAIAMDIDDIAKSGGHLLPTDWQKRLPNNSCPYSSTIVFLVRKGNPLQINDWDDLAKPGVRIVTPNPKTSGGACWNYLAMWGYALQKELTEVGGFSALQDPAQAQAVKAAEKAAYEFTKKIYANAVKQGMATGARDATDDFVKRGNGDVFLAWENEAILSKLVKEDDGFEIIVPSVSIKAEPPVALLDVNVDKHGNRDIAEEYLLYLYEPVSQDLLARHHFRPCNREVAEKYRDKFPVLELFNVDDIFGGWTNAQRLHFNSDGLFDKMVAEISR